MLIQATEKSLTKKFQQEMREISSEMLHHICYHHRFIDLSPFLAGDSNTTALLDKRSSSTVMNHDFTVLY